MEGSGVIQRYRDFLPITDATPIISLNEGSTPLIEAPNIVQALSGDFRLFVKYDSGLQGGRAGCSNHRLREYW